MKITSLWIVLLVAAGVAFAQTPTASIVGRITDASGAVIPGVAIKVTNPDTNLSRSALSSEDGNYEIPFLNPARYVLEASATGFHTYRREEITLQVDQVLRLDIRLEIGAVQETVNVVAEALPALNTETSTLGDVTSKDEIAELPLAGRAFADLAYLSGGVGPKASGADGSFAVNGARADNGGFLLDGMNNTQRRNTNAMVDLPVEGVQEFKMLTSGFSAEYGRYSGGMLSVVTKSGTNQLKGSLYDFLRNDLLDARGYFDPDKSKLRRNQFGATVSGPVYIPKIYDGRNRTFFLFTWESLRQIAGLTQLGLVPTPAMLRGDFSKDDSGKALLIKDPLLSGNCRTSDTRACFPNSQIPLGRQDPVALKLAKYFPAPNYTSGTYNFLARDNSTDRFDSFGIKIDHSLGDKDRLTGSIFWRPASNWGPIDSKNTIPYFGTANNTLQLLTYLKYLKILSPTLLLEASVNYSHRSNNEVWPHSAEKDWQAETGFVGGTTSPVAAGVPYLSVTNYVIVGPVNGIPKIWKFDNYQAMANLTVIRGRHSMKAGADILRLYYTSDQWADTRGRAVFTNSWTGFPAADFLLGYLNSSRRALGPAGPHVGVTNLAAFVQDDFKVSRSLTLNLGLRYDVLKPPAEKRGMMAQFLPDLGKVVTAGLGGMTQEAFNAAISSAGLGPYTVMASSVGLPASIIRTNWNNFAPRFGFAWRMFGSSRLVLRGGYGIFYGSGSMYRFDGFSQVYPYAITEVFSRVSSDATRLTLSNPFPTDRRGFSGVNSTSGMSGSRPENQYLQNWNLTVEREFLQGTVLQVTYAGSKGTHLQRVYDINQPGRDQASSNIRPYPFFGSISITNDGASSIYHSGQITMRRRFSKQLFVRGSYTWAKAIDESSNTGGVLQYNFPQAQDSRNLQAERGRADFDVRHALVGSFIWTPTLARHWLLRDWQLSGIWTLYSGQPFTPRIANSNYAAGEATRPDRLATGSVSDPNAEKWYDVGAFKVVPTGAYRFGNSGRNILDGPGTIVVNAALSRRIRFTEARALQIRMEAFNLTNHGNLGMPENNVDLPTAGSIRSANNSRNLQIGLRLEF